MKSIRVPISAVAIVFAVGHVLAQRSPAAGAPNRAPDVQRLENAVDVPARHLTLKIGTRQPSAGAGKTLTLVLDVTPDPRIHVYAPGQEGYIPISLTLPAAPAFEKAASKFPPPESFFFAPTSETFKVYSKPFQFMQDVTVSSSPELRRQMSSHEPLSIAGTLGYQACDDRVCYRPESVPVRWSVPLDNR